MLNTSRLHEHGRIALETLKKNKYNTVNKDIHVALCRVRHVTKNKQTDTGNTAMLLDSEIK